MKEKETAAAGEEKAAQEKKRPRRGLIIGLSAAGAVLLIALAAFLTVHRYLSRINIVPPAAVSETEDGGPPELPEYVPEPADEPEGEDAETAEDSSQEEIDEVERAIDENLQRQMEAERNTKEVTNILLVGSDTRVAGQPGRSDSMMVLTVNRETKTLSLTSFLRDMYVHIPGYGNRRINTAFAMGGEPLLISTIEENFKLPIDYYATIDFFAFIEAIDAIGGVTLDISDQELYGVNYAIGKYNKDRRLPYGTGYLTEKGPETHLNGLQALGYARNRQFPDGDFSRTAHQRKLLDTLFRTVKNSDLAQVNALLEAFLPGITTDMPESVMLSFMTLLPQMLQYDVELHRIPVDGSYRGLVLGGASMLGVDFEQNIEALRGFVYGEEAQPAAAVGD